MAEEETYRVHIEKSAPILPAATAPRMDRTDESAVIRPAATAPKMDAPVPTPPAQTGGNGGGK